MTGIVIFAHGSTVEEANQAVYAVAGSMAQAGGYSLVEVAFLDCAPPDLAEAVRRLAERGAGRVLVIPYFLTLGTHLQRDLPQIVEEIARVHQGVEIRVARPLDEHPHLVEILQDRAAEGLGDWK